MDQKAEEIAALTLNAPSSTVYVLNVAGSMKNEGTKYVGVKFVFRTFVHP